jgi:4'-phosphopantetheinyl transferase EntD
MTPETIASLFTCPVGVGVTDPRLPSEPAYPQEGAAITRAVPKRRNEFLAGRKAARIALSAIGGPSVALPPGADRVPHWPDGFVGSITHCDDVCLAVATLHARAVGVDVEPATALPRDLWDAILLPEEQESIASAPNPGLAAKLIFSAKEAAYKAQYPISRVLYGFHDMHLILGAGRFQAKFRIAAGPFQPGDCVEGRIHFDSGHIVTAAQLG